MAAPSVVIILNRFGHVEMRRKAQMTVKALEIPDVKLITPRRFFDERGYFEETFNARQFKEATGLDCRFVQDNQSYSEKKWTLRGLHFQSPPHAQAKLVRAVRGAILDVAVDARKASPTFGKYVAATLSAENGAQMFVPAGFLHGFLTLAPDTHVAYKVDDFYSRECEGAVLWNDKDLAIDWGAPEEAVNISQKDGEARSWRDFKSPF